MPRFGPPTETWFHERFDAPTAVQRHGWERIARGENALLVAPTGSGKTLAAFLWAIDQLSRRGEGDRDARTRVLYVSPLKALVYDVERNLRAPLAGIRRRAEELGEPFHALSVSVRTGDTPQRERQRQLKDPGEILVTTPESLFLILGSRARENLRDVETVIVDEIHALAPTKRGAHLALSLERLSELAARDPQRIGLSATARPLDEMARFLGGDRLVEVVDASEDPRIDLEVRVPVPDMERVPPPESTAPSGYHYRQLESQPSERGLWPAIYPELIEEVRAHRSTILFVNSRLQCEKLTQRLNALAGEELARAHHGSISHGKREEIENGLKEGRIRAIVATSSLELGIDMGAVDLVLMVESPRSVARGLQRIGRAGHHVGETSRGRIYPKHKGDLLECAVLAGRMARGEIESLSVPRNALDVLAQQIVAICCAGPREVREIGALVRRAHPYRELGGRALAAVLDMLSGRFPSSDFADLRPRLRWDRTRDLLEARRGSELVSRMNAGTIPDRGAFTVHLGSDGPRIGELDEEMVFETRTGDTILLGATTWRVEEITRDRVVVSPAPGEPGRLPFWKGEGPGRPLELGRALGEFTRELGARLEGDAQRWLRERLPLGELAAGNLVDHLQRQKEATGTLPTDKAITVERFRDELGDWRVCILSPFGGRVHAPWALAIEQRLAERGGEEAQIVPGDDGIVLRLADVEQLPETGLFFPDPEEIVDLVTERLAKSSLFATLFRESAVRSLLVTRKRPGQRNPLWAQRLKTRALLGAVQNFPDFPIVLETYRQALSDVFDLPGLEELLRGVRSRAIAVDEVETPRASPFARSLVFAYVTAYLYDGDLPAAERRAQALTLDRGLLRELLGEAELRELIDPLALAELESELAGLVEERRARDRDELHDLLRRLGDLSEPELAQRAAEDPAPWLEALEAEGRAGRVTVAGEPRWIALEDSGLYRDALGCAAPATTPAVFLEEVENACAKLLHRWAKGRGPFLTREPLERFGLPTGQVEPILRALEAEGTLVRGEIRPGGSELEWCESEVLRRLKRRTLARLRREVEAVEARSLARFLPRWQGVLPARPRADALLEAIAKLEGLPLPWSTLEREILPARVPGLRPEALDLLCATGEVVWVGRGALGQHDGRVALYLRAHAGDLIEPPEERPAPSALHAAILARVSMGGPVFLTELERAVRGEHPGTSAHELEQALWELVWAGELTNDTLQPLRSLSGRRGRRARQNVLAGGRWSLVRELVNGECSETERGVARARTLLERYGIVSREAALCEELVGGFASLYPVLRAMEEAGRIRRGWFVEGLSGAQFAHPGAIDRLRAAGQSAAGSEPLLLPAIDPANAWGALLPWPQGGTADAPRPRRVPGAWVCLLDGWPVWYVPPGRRQVLLFPDPRGGEEHLPRALAALHELPRRGRALVIERIDGVPAEESPFYESFRAAAFVRDYRGLIADPARR